jgi:hypothetical protein
VAPEQGVDRDAVTAAGGVDQPGVVPPPGLDGAA